ncbi:hypothetical protein HGRIS_006419 [Hohenbuehelia grisea]|uniref:lytic cellulose monooxygenase (C4-dehydrogenating) n=1 Tax=Hohenbuehelia grisea TaxID=104357 RepID=A0ABR3JZU2_9AGAR
MQPLEPGGTSAILALQDAGQYPGAQFYMSCAQIEVSDGGDVLPSTVSFPGAYEETDPGIVTSIFVPNYSPPGPAVFLC